MYDVWVDWVAMKRSPKDIPSLNSQCQAKKHVKWSRVSGDGEKFFLLAIVNIEMLLMIISNENNKKHFDLQI